MADAKLRIVIDALNKAGDDLSKLKKDLQGVDQEAGKAEQSTQKFGGGLQSMLSTAAIAVGAVVAVGAAMKQVYETAREGADLLYVEDRFNNLTKAIGTTSDALMGDLRVATRGLKSDAELMQGAMDFMSLGLAKSHDEVVRLTSVAGALGMNMNQLVLTLTNRTTMRFDALGVSVDGFDAKVKALEASGLSVEDAFTEAFLQQAEEQIDKVGHAADSAKGSFDALEAAIKNDIDEIKKSLAEKLAPAVGWVAEQMRKQDEAQAELTKAVDLGIISQKEYASIMRQGGLETYKDRIIEIRGEVNNFTTAIDENAEANRYAKDPYYQNAEALIEFWTQAREAESALKDLSAVTLDADLAMKKYTESLLFKIASEGLGQEEALALAEAMGLVDEKTMYAATQVNLLRERYDAGLISADQYREGILLLGGSIDGLHDKSVTIEAILKDPANIKGWKLTDQKATYTITTVRQESGVEQRAAGGPVSADNPYLWQEYGYRGETLVPSQNGFVLSRADAKRILAEAANSGGGRGGTTFNITANYEYKSPLSLTEEIRLLEAAHV